MRKVIRFLSRTVDWILLIIFLLAFLVGGYAMYDSYLVYQQATDKGILKFRPERKEEFVEAAKAISEDMVAWIDVKDTTISYPVMQGENNSEYLNKDPYGDYALAGSIFLDSRNTSDFSDDYNLIYGHHMDAGAMFGALDQFLEKGFLEEHREGSLILEDKEYDINFFAITDASGLEESIFNPKSDKDPLEYTRANAHYYLEEPEEGAKIIALSTCKYPDTVDRTILFGIMTLSESENSKGLPETSSSSEDTSDAGRRTESEKKSTSEKVQEPVSD